MIKPIFKFIHTLRVFFLAFIIVGFLAIIGLNPVDVTKFIGAKLGAAVGVSTSVPENPFNKLAAQLKEKEEDLEKREQALDVREQEFTEGGENTLVIVLGVGIVVLFALVLLNYYLDYRRKKKEIRNY